ncbi:MAG: hypothetical protein ABI855_17415, partial [Bacteroidota bacterium]
MAYAPADGGYIIGGNSNTPDPVNGCVYDEEYFAMKIYSDCQSTLAENPPSLTFWDDANGKQITVYENWNADRNEKGIIHIFDGGTLEINNGAVISFASTYHTNDFDFLVGNNFPGIPVDGNQGPTKIVVEPGGTLIIDNATLKGLNECGTEWMWQGVELLGTENAPQTVGTGGMQGLMRIFNNGRIENAYMGTYAGLTAFDDDGRVALKDALGGGMLLSGISSFIAPYYSIAEYKNCQNSVAFAPYRNPVDWRLNRSSFMVTHFISDAPLVDPDYIFSDHGTGIRTGNETFAYLNQVHGINFRGTTFSNTIAGLPRHLAGEGIVSFDADYLVDRTCESINTGTGDCAGAQCEFHTLNFGIDAENTIDAFTLTVKGSHAEGNNIGVSLKNVMGATIIRNQFLVADFDPVFGSTAGLYMENCNGYKVEENRFNPITSGSSDVYGIVDYYKPLNHLANEIYNNQCGDFGGAGILAIGELEGDGTGSSGLKIKCNAFTNNAFDVYVAGINPGGGISSQQGTLPFNSTDYTAPANNTFDASCLNNEGKLFNPLGNIHFDYYYWDPLDPTDPNPSSCYTAGQVTPFPTGIIFPIPFDFARACPSQIEGGGGSGGSDRSAMNNSESQAEILQNDYDGGDKQALLDVIDFGSAT